MSRYVAVHWNGKRSPWKTTCFCDGINSKRGNSKGPAIDGSTKKIIFYSIINNTVLFKKKDINTSFSKYNVNDIIIYNAVVSMSVQK